MIATSDIPPFLVDLDAAAADGTVTLTDWEKTFVSDLVDREPSCFSEKQTQIIQALFEEHAFKL